MDDPWPRSSNPYADVSGRSCSLGRVDVLSDIVASTRIGQPHASRRVKRGAWGSWFAPFPGAGFHAVVQGRCWLLPASGQPVQLEVGDVAFLPHGSGHGLADGPATPLHPAPTSLDALAAPDEEVRDPGPDAVVLLCGGYVFDRAQLHPLLAGLPDFVHLRGPAVSAALEAALALLTRELTTPMLGGDAAITGVLDAVQVYLLRSWLAAERAGGRRAGWAGALADPAVATAIDAIHRHPATRWTVERLAERAHLSRAAFARRFADLVGQPPIAYLTRWRMGLAARELRSTDATLAAVASRLGYSSEFAFAAAFKRVVGVAPGRFRQRAARRPTSTP